MSTEQELVGLLRPPSPAFNSHDRSADDTSGQAPSHESDIATEAATPALVAPSIGTITVALIDQYRLSREYLTAALEPMRPQLLIVPFDSVEACLTRSGGLDLVLYVPHDDAGSEAITLHNVAVIRRAMVNVPLVVLSDSESTNSATTIRTVLNGGADGFIPAQTTGLGIAHAAIRFVQAGGTFAPLSQLLVTPLGRKAAKVMPVQTGQLTSRQAAVLEHLRQGKANKVIAYELNVSESTVKVHVRDIMRKLGATNRTQVAYKAQQRRTDD